MSTHAQSKAALKVAAYEDLSGCDFPAPSDEAGNNGNYVVGVVRVDWGDGTTTTATAQKGSHCQGDASEDEVGAPAAVIGAHVYKKTGVYHATVLVIYRRGPQNTYANCATITGGTTYNAHSNCVTLAGPATTTVTVKPPLRKNTKIKAARA